MTKRAKRILSIDGGGVRGILPAIFLRSFEELSGKRISDLFDLAVGTSTGGIIVLALTHSRRAPEARELLKIYLSHAGTIFDSPRSAFISTFFRPKYNNSGLRVLADLLFGEGRLAEAKIPTAVTAYDIMEHRPRVLKSWAQGENILLSEAALATSAAPTYFAPVKIGDQTLVDGGVFANNPSAIALAEAHGMWPNEDVVLVSLGTGVSAKLGHLPKDVNSWGAIKWLGPLLDIMFDGSSDSINYVSRTLLENKRYYRFQINIHPDLNTMDDASKSNLEQLRGAGEKQCDQQQDNIRSAIDILTPDTLGIANTQSKYINTDLSDIKLPPALLNEYIRCSFSGLVSIEVNGLYLLVRGRRIRHQYQPVGGVFKRLPPSRVYLEGLGIRDDDKMPLDADSKNDLRVRVPGKNVQAFCDWFESRRGREIDPWREFYEELIDNGKLDRTIFPYISCSLHKTHCTGIQRSDFMNCHELLASEIFVLHPTTEQLSHLSSTQLTPVSELKWVTRDEIKNRGLTSGVATISSTAEWLL